MSKRYKRHLLQRKNVVLDDIRMFISHCSRFVQKFEYSFWQIFFFEMSISILIWMHLDNNFFKKRSNLFRFKHVSQRNRLPLWPNLMQSCKKCSRIINFLSIGVSPFLYHIYSTLILSSNSFWAILSFYRCAYSSLNCWW